MSIEYYLQIKLKDYILKLEIVRKYLNNTTFRYLNGCKIAIDHISFRCIGLRQYVIFNYPHIYPYICFESEGNRYSSNYTTTDTVLQVLFINWQTLKQIT